MNRRDRAAIGALVAALAIVTALITLPAFTPPAAAPSASATPSQAVASSIYREGIVGTWTSITPVTARTAADRELVALVFSGLVRLDADGGVLPDLASSWEADPTGAHYTFHLRPDAVWQDGLPVTATDVAFTFKTLQDPGYAGPQATSWREVTVVVIDPLTVRFDLATPLGGFLQSATQPLLPEHLLRDVPPSALADSPFSRQPIGSGPFRLVSADQTAAELAPAALSASDLGQQPSPTPADNLAPTTPSPRPARPLPYLEGVELRFYPDTASLEDAYRSGALDAAVGLPPADAAALAAGPNSRLLLYPTSTLTAVIMNQRGGSIFRDARLRQALLALVDRDSLVQTVLGGQGSRADSLIPPESWAFDAKASATPALSRTSVTKLLTAGGWRKLAGGWAAPGKKTPVVLSVIAPDQKTNPITFAAASQVAKAWGSFGFKVQLMGLAPMAFTTKLQSGSYALAFVDVSIGLDPDLYPLLASTQATSSGSNISGVQSTVLDKLLSAARGPGSLTARKKAYSALQAFLAQVQIVLPLYFKDEPIVLSNAVQGPVARQLGDPGDRFWDVLTWRLASGR